MSAVGWAGVFVLGGVGALMRVAVATALTARVRGAGGLPVGTLAVNLSGALVLGVLAGLDLSRHTTLLLGTAALGSYTTFSTWLAETHRLATSGRRGAAAANLGVSLALGVLAVLLGRTVGRAF